MDTSPGLNDRLFNPGGGSVLENPQSESSPEVQEPLIQRCVIIQRDAKGYGLTVSGDNPVFVQSVKEDGAASRAGVHKGDRIIKVNGTLVTGSNHHEVVTMIKSGSYVALTLLGKPHGTARGTSPGSGTLQPLNHTTTKLSSASERITGPQPVDSEKQHQLNNARIVTIRKMLGKEVAYMKNLEMELQRVPSEKKLAELTGAKKRVKTLEDQLFNLSGLRQDTNNPTPRSPPAMRHSPSEKENRVSYIRSFTHQSSVPCLPRPPTGGENTPSLAPLSLETHSSSGKMNLSTSMENLVKHLSPRTLTWVSGMGPDAPHGAPTHSRQSSTPDALLNKSSLQDSVFKLASSGGSDILDSRKAKRKKTSMSQSFSEQSLYDSCADSPVTSPPSSPPPPLPLVTDLSDLTPSQPEQPELIAFTDNKVEGCDVKPSTPIIPPCPGSLTVSKATQLGGPPEGHVSPLPPTTQHPNILCMEDDDFCSDPELSTLEHHGPFNGVWKLVRFPAHLAVFIHYLNSNGDPSTLFFYLIAEMFEQGTLKEMKKWAYEIHSSFLLPGAPLPVKNIDESILRDIDEILINHLEKEDITRSVFRKAMVKAKEEINDQLAEFRNKRVMGLGNFYGPQDSALEEAIHDKTKEIKIIEQKLLPTLEALVEDMDSLSDKNVAMAYALATILKQFGAKSPACMAVVERCPSFVARDKTLLRIIKSRKMSQQVQIKGHHFQSQHYTSSMTCSHCQLLIWGIGNQGYHCLNCDLNIHKQCLKIIEELCVGPLRANKKDKKLMENWFGKTRKTSQPVPSAIEHARRLLEESQDSESASDQNSFKLKDALLPDSLIDSSSAKKGQATTSIGRSESFRQRRESRPSFRKRSDPNIPRSKSDVEVEDTKLNNNSTNLNESGSSSNSSLSARSLDSPSNSIEMVHRGTDGVSSIPPPPFDDSDLEAEADPPDWNKIVDWEVVRLLKPKEKKRQDVINELFHTERTHVRNLKVLDRLFYRPLVQEQLLSQELLQLLFSNLDEMIEIHSGFNNKMKTKRKEENLIGNVGEMMLQMLDGVNGENLMKAAATFCNNQSIALELLKQKQKKDQKLSQFLIDAEANPLCRRLQLKDIIATGFQRLTKYPLLLENIAKHTASTTEEHSSVIQAVECSKNILAHVNQAVKETENHNRLNELQKKVDKSSMDKQFKSLDLTKHRMLYEGMLTWRLSKQKTLDVHVVLLEEIILLFQKQDDRYILKPHNNNFNTNDMKVIYNPILQVDKLFTRNVAVDKRGFFLVSTDEPRGAMYEFVASSAAERMNWLKHLEEAIEICRELNNESSQPNSNEPGFEEEIKTKPSIPITETPAVNEQPGEPIPPPVPPHATPLPSAPPEEDENQNNKATIPELPPETEKAKPQRRLQRVEILQIADGPKLIEPSEVVVNEGATLQLAEPVLTTLERLRRKDLQISQALEEKEALIAEVLQIPLDRIATIKDEADPKLENQSLDMKELLFATLNQVNQLTVVLNDTLKVTEEDAISASSGEMVTLETLEPLKPTASPRLGRKIPKLPGAAPEKLMGISAILNKHLNQLMSLVNDVEEERRQLRMELHNSREQIHHFYEHHRDCVPQSVSTQETPSKPLEEQPSESITPPKIPTVEVQESPDDPTASDDTVNNAALIGSTTSAEIFVDAPSEPQQSYQPEAIYF